MKKSLLILLLAVTVVAITVTPGYTWHHWRGGVYVGVGPYWGPYPYYYPPPYYVYRPPTVVIEEPPVYVERPPAAPAAPPAPPAAATAYWYYCSSAKGYYPTVPSCPEEWIKVPPR